MTSEPLHFGESPKNGIDDFKTQNRILIRQVAKAYRDIKLKIKTAKDIADLKKKPFYVLVGEDHEDRFCYLMQRIVLQACKDLKIEAYMPELHDQSLARVRKEKPGDFDKHENCIALVHDADALQMPVSPVESGMTEDDYSGRKSQLARINMVFLSNVRPYAQVVSQDGGVGFMVEDVESFKRVIKKRDLEIEKVEKAFTAKRMSHICKNVPAHSSALVCMGADHIKQLSDAFKGDAVILAINATRYDDIEGTAEYIKSCVGTHFEGCLEWLLDPNNARQMSDLSMNIENMDIADLQKVAVMGITKGRASTR